MPIHCEHCKETLPELAPFCGLCGKAQGKTCLKCNTRNSKHFKYCSHCGVTFHDLKNDAEHALLQPKARRRVVLLFCDICNYTQLSRQMDPEELIEKVSPLFKKIVSIIQSYQGHIEKIIGDAVLGIFGIPEFHEDDSERAVLSALTIKQEIETHFPEFQLRFGLNMGRVVFNNLHYSENSHDYTVTGDAINIAARIQNQADPNGILVSDDIYKHTVQDFIYRGHPPLDVKGINEKIIVHELLRIRENKQQLQVSTMYPLYGRQEELEKLKQFQQSQKSCLMISGEGGIGKTVLLAKFLEAQKSSQKSVSAHASSYNQFASLSLVKQLLKNYLPSAATEKNETALQHIQSAFQGPEAELYSQIIYTILHPETELQLIAQLPSEQFEKLRNQALLQLFQSEPLIFILEDLQWCDAASLQWLEHFIKQTHSTQVYGLWRTQNPQDIPQGLQKAASIHLKTLTLKESLQLLADRLMLTQWPEKLNNLGQLLYTSCHGNPYFLEETLNYLKQNESLVFEQEWQLKADIETLPLPHSINDLIMGQLNHLDASDMQVLQMLSVAGDECRIGVLEQLTGQSAQALIIQLQADSLRSWIQIKEKTLSFQKALVRECLYDSLLKQKRKVLHQIIGAYLEKQNPRPSADTLAHHFIRAQNNEKALHYLYLAMRQAKRNGASKESLQSSLKAQDLIKKSKNKARMLLLKAESKEWLSYQQLKQRFVLEQLEILTLLGEYDEALAIIESEFQQAQNPFFIASLALNAGKIQVKCSRWSEAVAYYQRGEKALQAHHWVLEKARLLSASAWVTYRQGDYLNAEKLAQQALETLKFHSNAQDIAYANNVLGVISYHRENWEKALYYYENAISIQSQIKDLWGQGNSLSNMASVYVMTEQTDKAIEALEESLKLRSQLGDRDGIATSHNNLGHLYQLSQHMDKAIHHLREAEQIYQQLGNHFGSCIVRFNLGYNHFLIKNFHEAEHLMRSSIHALKELNAMAILPEALNSLSELFLTQGKHKLAEQNLKETQNYLNDETEPLQQARFQTYQAWLWALKGETEKAHKRCQKLTPLLLEKAYDKELNLLKQIQINPFPTK